MPAPKQNWRGLRPLNQGSTWCEYLNYSQPRITSQLCKHVGHVLLHPPLLLVSRVINLSKSLFSMKEVKDLGRDDLKLSNENVAKARQVMKPLFVCYARKISSCRIHLVGFIASTVMAFSVKLGSISTTGL